MVAVVDGDGGGRGDGFSWGFGGTGEEETNNFDFFFLKSTEISVEFLNSNIFFWGMDLEKLEGIETEALIPN